MQRLEGEELEQDRAQGVDVRARVEHDLVATRLLGRHVAGGAHHRAVDRADGVVGRGIGGDRATALGALDGRLDDLRQPPVEHVHLAEIADHDVVGLEVAVDDAARVRELDGETHAGERREQLVARPLAHGRRDAAVQLADDLFERLAEHAAHREVRAAVRVASEVVHRHDRRMLELTLDARLADEARASVQLAAPLRADHLHRDVATDAVIGAEVHLAHSPFAEPVADLVAPGGGLEVVHGLARGVARIARRARHGGVGQRATVVVVAVRVPLGGIGGHGWLRGLVVRHLSPRGESSTGSARSSARAPRRARRWRAAWGNRAVRRGRCAAR